MSPHATASSAASVCWAVAASLLVLLLLLLPATALATTAPSSFGNFDPAITAASFGTVDPAITAGSFGNFHLAPTPAAPSVLPANETEFVRQFSAARSEDDSASYRDTS